MHDDTIFILSHLSHLEITRTCFYVKKKSAASEKDKAKWSKVLIAGMMSSEVIVKMKMSSLLNPFSGVMKE